MVATKAIETLNHEHRRCLSHRPNGYLNFKSAQPIFSSGRFLLELQPHYVSGSLSETIMTLCAKDEPLDPALCKIARFIPSDYDEAIEEGTTKELNDYYGECQQFLRDIVKALD